jgi:hypothetical protein
MSISFDFESKQRLDRSQELFFAAIFLVRKTKVKRILEFVTFTGESTLVLRVLFPKASIILIDLPQPVLTSSSTFFLLIKNLFVTVDHPTETRSI